MAEIGNPYSFQSPIGAALANFSKAVMSGKSDVEKEVYLQNALKLKRQNENIGALGDVFRNYGTPEFDRGMAMDLAIRGGYDKLGDMERYGAANIYGAKDPRTTNAFVGAGGAYSSSPGGFGETLAENQRQFDMKPQTVGSPTGPVIAPLKEAYGQPAVEDLGKVKGDFARRAVNSPGGISTLNPNEQRFIGAAPGAETPRNMVSPTTGQNYISYDGVTDARTRQPLPFDAYIVNAQGTATDVGLRPTVTGGLQQEDIELQKFGALLEHTRSLAQQSAANFGVSGRVKGAAQDVSAIVQNLAEGLGYRGGQEAVTAMQQKAVAAGIDPGLLPGLFTFDPTLPSLRAAADILVFQGASALFGQRGRSVSNDDVRRFYKTFGHPDDWSSNQQKFLAKLDEVDRASKIVHNVIRQNLRRSAPSAAAPAAPGAPPPVPQAPGAPQAERWERGPDGLPRRVQ